LCESSFELMTHLPRLLFLDHAPFLGGAETVLLDIVRTIDRTRFEPIVGTPARSALVAPAEALGVRVIPIDLPHLNMRNPLGLLPALKSVRQLRAVLRREHIDLIHTNTVRAHLIGTLAAAGTPVRVVWHLHDDTFPRVLKDSLLSRPRRIVAISQYIAEFYGLTNNPCCEVIYNGVEINRVAERDKAFRQRWKIPADSPLIVNIGRLARWKGQAMFVQAVAQIGRVYPEARFAIVGAYDPDDHGTAELSGGPAYFAELQALCAAAGVADKMIFTGHISDMAPVYANADVVVHTATRPEPFGRVLIEAMAAGVPVIATNVGGPAEIVIDGETGLLVPAGDVAALAKAIQRLLTGINLCQRMGQAARRRVEDVFALKAQVEKLESVYTSALYAPHHS
jgi:glycosyltransferase involved in cell wall biosynthesis